MIRLVIKSYRAYIGKGYYKDIQDNDGYSYGVAWLPCKLLGPRDDGSIS